MSTTETPKNLPEKKGANKKIIIPIILILLLSIGVNIFLFINGNKTKEILTEKIVIVTQEKDEVTQLLDDAKKLVEELKIDTTNLSAENKAQLARIKQLQEEMEEIAKESKGKDGTIAALRYKYNKILKEIEELKKKVVLLEEKNEVLTVENTDLKTSVDSLTTTTTDLTKKVTEAEKLRIEYLQAKPLRNSFWSSTMKDDLRAKKIAKVELSYSVVKNSIAKNGSRTTYLRITNPEGNLLGRGEYGSGDFYDQDGNKMKFTFKADFDYTGEKEDFAFDYEDPNNPFLSGPYKLEVYVDGYKAAESMFNLE